MSLPAEVLLPYQRRLLEAVSRHPVVVVEKSRRIGATWGLAAHSALTAASARTAKGTDCLYIGYNLAMARDFIDTAAQWAKAFQLAAAAVEEVVLKDEERDIQAFRLRFASGFDVVALSSRPRSLRGKQGVVVIDEAAFHDDLPELLKAALALLMWGGRVVVISTHDGDDNAFAALVNDCRAGRLPHHVERITFDEALADGLYRRICEVNGREWSPAAEAAWRDEIVASYGDGADEELFCIPRGSAGSYLPRALIEARMVPGCVLRLAKPAEFAQRSEHERWREVNDWCVEVLAPELAKLDPNDRHAFGEDFGRSGDLTVLAPYAVTQTLLRRVPFLVELRNLPFRQQEQVLFFLVDRLPRLIGGGLDARGNGQYLAEVAAQRYGSIVEQVMLSDRWYLDNMPPFKAAFEDARIQLPADSDVCDDLRALQVIGGVPKLGREKTRNGAGQRHGDAAVALAIGFAATRTEHTRIEFMASGNKTLTAQLFPSQGSRLTDVGWGTVRGHINLRGWM